MNTEEVNVYNFLSDSCKAGNHNECFIESHVGFRTYIKCTDTCHRFNFCENHHMHSHGQHVHCHDCSYRAGLVAIRLEVHITVMHEGDEDALDVQR